MLQAEFIEVPEDGAHALKGRQRTQLRRMLGFARPAEQVESLLGERKKDVVLAGEVAVDGGGAVFDPLSDLADRHVLIALSREKLARRVQNGAADCFPVAFLSFFDSHELVLAPPGISRCQAPN